VGTRFLEESKQTNPGNPGRVEARGHAGRSAPRSRRAHSRVRNTQSSPFRGARLPAAHSPTARRQTSQPSEPSQPSYPALCCRQRAHRQGHRVPCRRARLAHAVRGRDGARRARDGRSRARRARASHRPRASAPPPLPRSLTHARSGQAPRATEQGRGSMSGGICVESCRDGPRAICRILQVFALPRRAAAQPRGRRSTARRVGGRSRRSMRRAGRHVLTELGGVWHCEHSAPAGGSAQCSSEVLHALPDSPASAALRRPSSPAFCSSSASRARSDAAGAGVDSVRAPHALCGAAAAPHCRASLCAMLARV
jgi:hypothetical protein